MIKSFCNCKMAGTNVDSARQKSAGDEMGLGRVPAQARPPRAKQRCNHPLALVVVLSSAESQDHKAPED